MTLSPDDATSTTGPEAAPTTTPAPPKSSRPRGRARPPLFASDPPADQPPSPESTSPPPSLPGVPASASESPDAVPPRRRRRGRNASSDFPGSDEPPTPPRRIDVKSRAQIKKAIAAAVRTAGARANAVAAAHDDTAGDAGLWLTDDEDQEGLSDPLSSIAARHLGPDALNPDLGDALVAIVALFAYVSKQLDVLARVRRARRTHVGDTAGNLNDQGAPAA